MDYSPAGKFWCPSCVLVTDFIVAPGYPPTDPQAPLECWDCGYVHDVIVEELERDGITHRAQPYVRPAIPKWQRQAAREKLREKFRRDIQRQGFRHENFTKPKVRRGD